MYEFLAFSSSIHLLTLIIINMFRRRGMFHLARTRTLTCYAVLSCILYCLAVNGLCLMKGAQNSPDYDACASFQKSYSFGSSDITNGDSQLGNGFPTTGDGFENVCPNSHSFCFPSMLSGFSSKEKNTKEAFLGESGSRHNSQFCVELAQDSRQASNKSWSSDYGVFRLLNHEVVSCSLSSREVVNEVSSLQTEIGISSCRDSLYKQKTEHFLSKSSDESRSNSLDGFVSPSIRIGPTVLDWGQKYLYSSSAAFLTVENTCNESTLHLYEPFSTDLQFYPCNFSEVSLRPGESVLVCFVFFPKCLGFSSASLILQTSSGGFIVEAKGYATESPFGIQALSGMEISPGGRLSRNFSLFNPFDETLYVEEVSAQISISLGDNSVETEVICSINDFQDFDTCLFPTIKDRLVVKSSQIGSPIVAIRPHRNWDISPHSRETLLEMDIALGFEGKIFGAVCLHVLRSSQDTSDTIMVPIEAEVDNHSAYDVVDIFVSATLEGLAISDSGEIAITISLRNDAPYILSFVKVLEVADMELFHIKYKEGLLLFPGTVTQVGIIYCSHLHMDSPKVSCVRENCKLSILTNDSTSPVIEILCEDILNICFKYQRISSVSGEGKSQHIQSGNIRAGYMDRSMQLPPNVKVLETAEDEIVLENWKSQGTRTTSDMSVLEDREVLFQTIQVGTYVSRWITVKNPSQHPVMMQLILNSGAIINECKGQHDLSLPSSDNLVVDEGATPKKYGFSVPENALTEAYVQPYDHVALGPIIFHPSDRCRWSGSALVRNNLSGVEWIPLRGFGGLLSLVLLDRSKHVQSVDFDLELPKALNFSLQYSLFHMKEMSFDCSLPLVKQLIAKNTGDLPLDVKSIKICGVECGGVGGFKIHYYCTGFTLEPGESIKFMISYQIDFSAAMVHRDLEFVMANGIFVIPVKASFPNHMLSNCKKSMFWMRVKHSLLAFLLIVGLSIAIYWIQSPDSTQSTALEPLEILVHTTAMENASVPDKTNNVMEASCDRNSCGQGNPSDLKHDSENHHSLDTPGETIKSPTEVQSSEQMDASQSGDLLVKTGNKKRRKKRKGRSGNSTPSSPLSPIAASATPKCNCPLSSDAEQPLEADHSSSATQVDVEHSVNNQGSASSVEASILKPAFPMECYNNDMSPHSASTSAAAATSPTVQLPSTTSSFAADPPTPSSPTLSMLSECTTATSHDRAPGSSPKHSQKAVEAQEAAGLDANVYTYDIWGDHFTFPQLLDLEKVTDMKCSPVENDFQSFFVNGPDNYVKNSEEEG